MYSGKIFIYKHNIYFFIIIFLPLLSDIIYASLQYLGYQVPITTGVFARGIIIIISFYVFIAKYDKLERFHVYFIAALISLFIINILISASRSGDMFYNISSIAKAIFLPMVSATFYWIFSQYNKSEIAINKSLAIYAFLASLVVIIPALFDIGIQSYERVDFGQTGLLFGANDLGLALGMAIFIIIHNYIYIRSNLINTLYIMTTLYALTFLGTRATVVIFFGGALTLFASLILFRNRATSFNKAGRLTRYIVSFMLISVFIYVGKFTIDVVSSNELQQERIERLLAGELPREKLIEAGEIYLSERSTVYNVFGEGADSYEKGVGKYWAGLDRRIVEVDWMDGYGKYGIIFTVLTHLFVIMTAIKGIICSIRYKVPEMFIFSSGLFMYLGHSAIAGHALFSPMPSTVAAIYIALIWIYIKRTGRHQTNRKNINCHKVLQ